jgi:hypothetical protein
LLLKIIGSSQVTPQIQLAASIALKQLVSKKWHSEEPGKLLMNDEDKLFVKNNIVEALVHVSNNSIR